MNLGFDTNCDAPKNPTPAAVWFGPLEWPRSPIGQWVHLAVIEITQRKQTKDGIRKIISQITIIVSIEI